MAGPLAGIAIRYVVQRAGGFAVKTVAKQYGKRTSRQRMKAVAARKGGIAMAPAPQGPFTMGHQMRQSTRGEHSQLAGHLKTRKSMRDGLAPSRRTSEGASIRFRRDEERYRGRRY
jgi:hypothetical protein